MQPRWRCCFPAAVALLLLRASSAASLVYARFLSSRRLQTKERWHRQLPLLHQQHLTSFFVFVPSSALCPSRPTGRRHILPRKRQCAETSAAAAAKPATRRTSVSPGAGISAAGGRTARRLQKAARQTAAAAAEEETATRTFAAAHFAAAFAAHLPSSAAAAQKTAPAYLTAPLHAALSGPAAPSCRRATLLRICRTAARGLLSRCVAPHAALQAADAAAVGTAGATPVTAAAGTAPRAAAAGGGGGGAGGGTAATARKDVPVSGGSSVVSCATHLINETQRAATAQVACEPAANETETTAEEEGQLQLQQDVLGKNFRPAAADASVKPQDIASTCGVPVGSVAALQEYARRLGFSLRRDGDVEVVSSSSLHAIEESEQQQELEPQQREERDQRKPLPQDRRGGTPAVAEERWREKPLQREQEQEQQLADPLEWTREEQHQQQRSREQQQRPRKRRVVVLGSTGSIGRSTLQVVEAFPERFEVVGLAAAGTDLPLLLHQIRRHGPRYVAVGNAATAAELRKLLLSSAAVPQAAAAAVTPSFSAGASPAAGAAASTFLATVAVASAHAATATATFAPAAGSAADGAGAAGARSAPTTAAQSPSLAAATSPGTAAALPPAACNATNVLPAGAAASRAAPPSPLLDARAPATVPLPGVAAGCSVPEIVYGDEGLVELAALDGYDVLVSAIVGFAGLQPTLKALTTGKDVALANKEALVAAGSVFRSLYERCNQRLHGRDGRSQGRSRQVSARSATPLGSSSDFAGTRAAASAASEAAAGSTRFPPCAAPFPSPTSFSSFSSPSLYPSPLCAQPQQQQRLGMLLPVDSEHSAIFQALQGVAPTNYPPRRLLLVATGGPFRGWKRADLQQVTLGQVLKHPRWSMGAKISVDSATLMNKGLEVIEAHYAFGCPYTGIDVLVHPQAIVHSAVELCDGAVLAQLGTPDMKLPIAYALTWPERLNATWPRLDLLREGVLTFEKPDLDTFGCLRMAYEAGMRGGLAPACLNAANEIAVSRLLDKKLSFLQIEELVRHVLREYDNLEGTQPASDAVTLQDVLEADAWARRIAREWKK